MKNPVYRKEIMVGNRSMKLSAALFAFCSLLAAVALYSVFSAMEQVGITSEIQYSQFSAIYPFISFIAYILLMLMVPAIAAGQISGEDEQGLLDLIMITDLTPLDIILGKLLASLTFVFVLALTALPIQIMVFIYGGTTIMSIILMLCAMMISALLEAGISIFFSALMRKTMAAMICSYGALAVMFSGLIFFGMASGNAFARFVLLFNPAITFVHVLTEGHVGYSFLSMAIQLALACLFMISGARVLKREFHRKKDVK